MGDRTENDTAEDGIEETGQSSDLPFPDELIQASEDLPPEKREQILSIFQAHYSGPLPLPSHLAQYDKVVPGAADRIIALAERQSAHRQSIENRIVDADIADRQEERNERKRGQFLGFSIGTIAIIAGAIVAGKGYQIAGTFIGGGGVVGLVTVFVLGRKLPSEERHDDQGNDE